MVAKPKHYAQGERKGYQEGKRVGYEEGWKRGREEGRQEGKNVDLPPMFVPPVMTANLLSFQVEAGR